MKRELGIARCGLACCLCSENVNCAGCNSGDVRIKNGVKTESVHLIDTVIALCVLRIARKGYWKKSSRMDLHGL